MAGASIMSPRVMMPSRATVTAWLRAPNSVLTLDAGKPLYSSPFQNTWASASRWVMRRPWKMSPMYSAAATCRIVSPSL